ncbi:MAG TPA: hypothetical protein VMT32_13680 [Bryobacteraceae bacterium]|nr:hypothetical protein [Bryobacteraceae bacterium]
MSIPMRISKYPPIFGIGCDFHNAIPPNWVAPPPAPPSPTPSPANKWLVIIGTPWSAMLTGKWTMPSVATEGMGDILWQYDWGPLQFHFPIGPVFLSPLGTLVLTLGSSIKYWLPSFAVQEKLEGGAIAMMAGGKVAVAITTPAWMIITQDCQDIGGKAFVAPTSICFQAPSTRWVGFSFGDFMAGLIGMAADALLSFVISRLGGKLLPGTLADNQLFGGLAGNLFNLLAGLLGGTAGMGPFVGGLGVGGAGAVVGFGELGGAGVIAGGWAVAGIGAAVAGAWVLGQVANAVGGDERPWDTGGPGIVTPPPPAATPPPQDSGPDAGIPSGTGGQSGSSSQPPIGPPPPPADAGPPPASTSSSSSSSSTPDPNTCDPNDPNRQ